MHVQNASHHGLKTTRRVSSHPRRGHTLTVRRHHTQSTTSTRLQVKTLNSSTKRHSSQVAAAAVSSPKSFAPLPDDIPDEVYPGGPIRMIRPREHRTLADLQHPHFKIPLPEEFNIGYHISDRHVDNGRAEHIAMYHMDEHNNEVTMSYGTLSQKSNQIGHALRRVGVKVGDKVSLLLSQSPETAIAHAGVFKIGAISIPMSTLFGAEAIEYRIKASETTVLFVDPAKLEDVMVIHDKLPNVTKFVITPPAATLDSQFDPHHTSSFQALLHEAQTHFGAHRVVTFNEFIAPESTELTPVKVDINQPAIALFTSGTTGLPKLVIHASRILLGHLPGIEFFSNIFPRRHDVYWTPAEWSWIGGLLDALLPSLYYGVPIVSCRMRKFDPIAAYDILSKFGVTNSFMPPTALKMMRLVPHDPTTHKFRVRAIGSGGESLGLPVLEWGRSTFGIEINEFFGQTEHNMMLSNSAQHYAEVKPGSMGLATPGHRMEIIDDQGNILPIGSIGNIAAMRYHPTVLLEYQNNAKSTQEKFVGDWLLTGDLGKKDNDGYFFYIGRNDDVINSAGYRIGPAEVEGNLAKHPWVALSAVVGVPDETRNEVVKAFVALTPQAQCEHFGSEEHFRAFIRAHPHGAYENTPADALTRQLTEYVKEKLAKHEFPRQIELLTVDMLPQTSTGKIQRKILKKQEYQRYYEQKGETVPEGLF